MDEIVTLEQATEHQRQSARRMVGQLATLDQLNATFRDIHNRAPRKRRNNYADGFDHDAEMSRTEP